MSIIIIPHGDLCNKIMSLVGAIDLSKKTKKNVELWYSNQYLDELYNENFEKILEKFPKLNLDKISFKFFKNNLNNNKEILKEKISKKILEKYNINQISRLGVIANEFPILNFEDRPIIIDSYIRGYKNSSFDIIKNWLKDVTKYRSYKKFIDEIGFNWINTNKNLCIINIQISEYYDGIYNNFDNYHYIHSINYYEEALKIISKKSKLPLYFIIMTDTNIDSLINFYNKIEEYGEIIYINEKLLNRNNITILASKAKYIIGSLNHYYSTFLCHIFDNIELSISPNFEIIDKNNYSKKVYILDDDNFKIINKREVLRNNLFITKKLSFDDKFWIYKSNYWTNFKLFKNYYELYDKLIDSIYLKKLLLHKHYYNDENQDLREVNSNISLSEGIELFKIIKKYNPKKLVEIGFAVGISTLFMLCALENDAILYSVDPYQKIQWNKFGLINVNNLLDEQKLPKKMHKFIEDYSINFFKKEDRSYDLVFIDGDHSYEGTMIDLYGADKVLKKNGLMIIDDVLHYDVKKSLKNFLKKKDYYKKIDTNLATMNFYIKKR